MIYNVTDLAKAKAWYSQVLEREPHFLEAFCFGFSIGGFELGLNPDGTPGPGGTVPYWSVVDAAAGLRCLESLGATAREPLQDVGGGIKVAAVADSFGNTFGVVEHPHFSAENVE